MERIDWQLSSLGLLFLAGIGWGFVEDCFQLLKKGKKRPVLDFIFWPVSVILLAPVIFFVNWGKLRLYVWITLGLGYLLYRKLFHPPLLMLFK